MSRNVFCRKYQQTLPGLDVAPLPGVRGQDIYDNISSQAWQEWLTHQTRLINEKRLKVFEPATRQYLQEQMDRFFNNQSTDQAEGYVPERPDQPGAKP